MESMKWTKWIFAGALLLTCPDGFAGAGVDGPGGLADKDSLDRKALGAFLQRIVKDRASRFEIGYIAPEHGKDVFELAAGSAGGKILLRGSNGVSVASALNYYLRHYCHSLITWNGVNLHLPAVMPVPAAVVHKVTPYTWRYYLNYCTFQYSMAWWDWDRWQQEIDWMALNGINMPLALTGEEGIWQRVYRSMGFSEKELDKFYTGPAFFSWLWMGNIDAWGGPLPAHWKEAHLALQQKILRAERAMGMKTVLPAFTGHVPPSFKDRYPRAKVKKTNWDAGFPDVYILDPSDPLFETIGKKYIEAQTALFGTDHFYSADTFNENVPPTSDSSYLDEMSKKVYASMAQADLRAVWVMQGWMFHYNASFWKPAQIQGLLKAVPDDHMIVLDLYSESHPVWNRTSAYYGKPWIWNMLHNFGGNISLWGRMSHVAEDPSAALHDPASGKMVGIGLTPEGIEQNPALYQLMLENVWQDSPVKLHEWLREYALQRYGVADPSIDKAWKLLEASVYRGGLGEGGNESIIVARPTMEKTIDRVLTKLDYDPAKLTEAWGLFIRASPGLGKNDGFRYDLVDITRQVLANYASPLQQRWVEAYRAHDTAAYRRYSREFLVLLDDMDRLLSTRKDFLLGKWIAAARSNGITTAEQDLYELNARNLVTLWGDKESILREYSCRQWAGLIRGFYKPRWELFFQYLNRAMVGGVAPDLKDFDRKVKDQEWQWVNSHKEKYSAEPAGDPVATALEMYQKYSGLAGDAKTTNDHIFPAAAVARPFIDFDGKGLIINGRRTFLVSAGLEYARMPRELWKDRLLRLQRAGFNCVEIYTFWNYHEPRQGVFDFSGDHDLEGFLRLAASMGIYVIARVGPYYCAEWDNGGYPLWLRFQPGLRVREDNAAFEQCVDRFFDKLLPIVCRNQINRGGSVIMVQLENEHNDGWGTAVPNGYFRHLREKALSMGVEVPYFFSGLHHASDPAGDPDGHAAGGQGGRASAGVDGEASGDPASLDDASRLNPWLTTEFWSVWYNGYGSGEKEARTYERRTWKIITHGGGGYNYYMAYGGTNFGYTNNDEDAASYDYGAAVGQAGDLRPMYYGFKRAAWFARSFQDILCNAVDATAKYRGMMGDSGRGRASLMSMPAIRVTARHSPAGDIVFYDNPTEAAVKMKLRATAGWAPLEVSLGPGEIFPVVTNYILSERVKLEWAPVRILGVGRAGGNRTMVVYGDAGAAARMVFGCRGSVVVMKGAMKVAGGRVSFSTKFPEGVFPEEYIFRSGEDRVRILVMNRKLADRAWFTEDGEEVVVGPAYAGLRTFEKGAVAIGTETPRSGGRGGPYPVLLYGKGTEPMTLRSGDAHEIPAAGMVALQPWSMKDAVQAAGPGYDDGAWMAGELAPQMGSDGDGSPNAWYRTRIRIDSAGPYVLQVEGGDRAAVFVDGHFMAAGNIHDGGIPLTLTQGPHVLAIFTAHDGRDKLAGFTGDMLTVDRKGLTGMLRLVRGAGSSREMTGWKFLRAVGPQPGPPPTGAEAGWMDYTIGKDVFSQREGYGWFRTELPAPPAGVSKGMLTFRSVDENATVFINGRRMMRHEGWNIPFQVSMEGLDTMARPLVVTIFIENYSNEGGIDRPVKVNYLKDVMELKGWRMQGGIQEPRAIRDWQAVVQGAKPSTGSPCYYRTEFNVPVYGVTGDHPIYRVHTDGLGHGSVWVNGQNLGRYPEKVPAPGLYIPECWLKEGVNELVVFDEDGQLPGQVSVQQEPAACRMVEVYSKP